MNETIDSQVELVTVSYPDPLFRPVPRFSIDFPPQWLLSDWADALYVAAPSTEAPEPWSNITVRHERVFRTTTLLEVSGATWNALKELHPEVELKEERLMHLNSDHYVREVEVRLPDYEGPITRFDTFVFAPAVEESATLDLIHLTFLNEAEHTEQYKNLYVRMLASFEFLD